MTEGHFDKKKKKNLNVSFLCMFLLLLTILKSLLLQVYYFPVSKPDSLYF